MTLNDLSEKLREQSFDQVIIRARQYLRESGIYGTISDSARGSVSRGGKTYQPALEIQAIACHHLKYEGRETGFIWLSYNNPTPLSHHPDYPKPPMLRSVFWTGKNMGKAAWYCICNSWLGVPVWLSQKPVIFCRQFHLEDEYTCVPLSDVMFLRSLDELVYKTEQHKQYQERRINQLAEKTPLSKRGEPYRAALLNWKTRGSLLSTIEYRLSAFTNRQFSELVTNLGVVLVQETKIPFS